MPGPLYRLVYRSILSPPAGTDRRGPVLAAILDTSRRRNAVSGLTGALLHAGEAVVQVLEGPLVPLEETYDRISADMRHTALTLLQFVPIEQRAFPDWRMASLARAELERAWPEIGTAALIAEEIPRMIACIAAALPSAAAALPSAAAALPSTVAAPPLAAQRAAA